MRKRTADTVFYFIVSKVWLFGKIAAEQHTSDNFMRMKVINKLAARKWGVWIYCNKKSKPRWICVHLRLLKLNPLLILSKQIRKKAIVFFSPFCKACKFV